MSPYFGQIIGKVTSRNVVVSCTFFVFLQCIGQANKVHETATLLLVTLPNSLFNDLKNISTDRLRNKPFLIW